MNLQPRTHAQKGAALVTVLMALALLFSLGVPFLFASRLRSEASAESYFRSVAQVSVDSAAKSLAFAQARSHPALDPTPLWDAADEWNRSSLGVLPQSLGAEWEKSNESWGTEVESLQSKVSLSSAPVMLLQNLLHPCFLSADVSYRADKLPVTSTSGFPEQGVLLIGTRWLEYGGKTPTAFTQLSPPENAPDNLDEIRFREGYLVQDPRVQALVLANFSASGHRPPEFLNDVFHFDFGLEQTETLPESDLQKLAQLCTLQSGAYGVDRWEPASWTTRKIDPEYPHLIAVQDDSLFNMGTVVRILGESGPAEDRLVISAGAGRLALSSPVPLDFDPLSTRVYPLRREPVDINACRPEVLEALAMGVAFRGSPPVLTGKPTSGRLGGREWVSPTEARSFALEVLRQRPLQGPQDLWDRVLFPLSEKGALSDADAYALYLNGLDPNNGSLRQSTTAFGYRSGDRYQQVVHAAVRSRLGRTLSRVSVRQKVAVAPAGPLLSVIQDQTTMEDFGRWNRGLHGVISLPNALGSLTHDFAAEINGLTLQLGTLPELGRQFPDDGEETSVVMPMPARETEVFPFNGRGLTQHFDYEPSPLGRYIPEAGPYSPPLENWKVTDDSGLSNVQPLFFQAWFYGEDLTDGALFELSAFDNDRNRVVAAMENGELVVRCQGTTGPDDYDPDGLDEEIVVRLDPATYSIQNRWFHLSVLLRELSPRGVQVMVDGIPRGDIDGFTHLTQAVASYAPGDPPGTIFVESTEGFPARGVLRIGAEVMEYTSKTQTSFVLDRDVAMAFGGRAIREANDALALTLDTSHPQGAGVELYGYSALLVGDIPAGGKTLSGEVGPWSFANLLQGVDNIDGEIPSLGITISLGKGINASYVGPIELSPLKVVPGDTYYEKAFQADGGYAVMWSAPLNVVNAEDGSPVGGVEIVKYSSRSGTTLTLAERNVILPGVEQAPMDDPNAMGFSSSGVTYVMEYRDGFTLDGVPFSEHEALQVYILPISVHANGASEITYRPGTKDYSEFVQIGIPADANSVEWVRYDHIVDGHFVRDDWGGLVNVLNQFFQNLRDSEIQPPNPGRINGGMNSAWIPQGPNNNMQFRPVIGQPVGDRDPLITATLQDFHFRGVLGTFDHLHQAGAEFVPVITTQRVGLSAANTDPGYGYVGRFDRVAVMQVDSQSTPFWYTVNWSRVPEPRSRVRPGLTYLAFDSSPGIPFVGPSDTELAASVLGVDRRVYARLCKFPNHERPQSLGNFVVGGTASSILPSFRGYVDEVSLQAVGGQGPPEQPLARGALILQGDLLPGENARLLVNPFDYLVDGFRVSIPGTSAGAWLQSLPSNGLLDIDGELIAYEQVDPGQGELLIARQGRGLLGTEIRGHSAGTSVRVVDGRAAAVLESDMDPNSESIQVANQAGFAPNAMLLVNQELMHAPMRGGGGFLSMPRARRGEDGSVGRALLRGRFGTDPAAHSAGTLVYSFPNRWMDNYIAESDSGVGAWFQLGFTAADALWKGLAFDAELPDNSLAVRVLARVGDLSWEANPQTTSGLVLIENGHKADGGFQPLGLRNDHLDLRVLFDWGQGAFDPVLFQATGWTQAPRLRRLVLDYLANTRVERREEVVE